MRIEIDVSAANDPDAHRWLDRILHKVDDAWHVWDTTCEPDPEELKTTVWFRDEGRQGECVHELFVASVQRDAWTSRLHSRRMRVTMHPNGTDELNPEDALHLAEEPLVILVENRNSDGAFLCRVVTELDKLLSKYWRRRGEPIRFDSVGGKGEMPEEVERRIQAVAYRPRLVAVIDSDRKFPDDNISHDARRLQRVCNTGDVPCWVLAKREAENYLPRILLAERENTGEDHARRVDAWNGLSEDQKNFFDMKDGLSAAPCAGETVLFDGLSDADRTTLSPGFGPRVFECWSVWAVQAKSELIARGEGDLQHGIDLIRGEV